MGYGGINTMERSQSIHYPFVPWVLRELDSMLNAGLWSELRTAFNPTLKWCHSNKDKKTV